MRFDGTAAEAIRAYKIARKLPQPLVDAFASVSHGVLDEIVAWLDGEDGHPEPLEALAQLPDVLKSELALARAEERAKKAGG